MKKKQECHQEKRKLDILVSTFIQMYLGVSLERCASSERFATHLAVVRTNTCVSPHVEGETVPHSEPHATHRALIRFLSCMNTFMFHLVMRAEEAAPTETTLVRTVGHVRLDVRPQQICVCKCLTAVDARVIFESSVDLQVCVEVAMFTEDLLADWTFVPQQREMFRHMFLHIKQK
jgi:hypothetical protein